MVDCYCCRGAVFEDKLVLKVILYFSICWFLKARKNTSLAFWKIKNVEFFYLSMVFKKRSGGKTEEKKYIYIYQELS